MLEYIKHTLPKLHRASDVQKKATTELESFSTILGMLRIAALAVPPAELQQTLIMPVRGDVVTLPHVPLCHQCHHPSQCTSLPHPQHLQHLTTFQSQTDAREGGRPANASVFPSSSLPLLFPVNFEPRHNCCPEHPPSPPHHPKCTSDPRCWAQYDWISIDDE